MAYNATKTSSDDLSSNSTVTNDQMSSSRRQMLHEFTVIHY